VFSSESSPSSETYKCQRSKPWNRLPREAVDAPSMEEFKARLGRILGSLSWWLATLPIAQGWSSIIFKVPSNLSHSMLL